MNIPSGVILYIPLLLDYEVVTGDTPTEATGLKITIGFPRVKKQVAAFCRSPSTMHNP
jgi:hypothetical protein